MFKKIFFIFLFFLFCLCGCRRKKPKIFSIKTEPLIRVLLVHASDKKSASIATTGSYEILDKDYNVISKGKKFFRARISARKGHIWIGLKKYAKKEIWLQTPSNSKIIVNKKTYYGDLRCFVGKSGKLQVVNILAMEPYIACVLGGEMPLNWHQNALRAQTIIARTYALYEKLHNKKENFDVYDTVRSQVYRGIIAESDDYAHAITKSTQGQVLLYKNALFKCFFHSTCGGHTTNAAPVFGYSDITPLSGRKCPFCQTGKYYNWQYHATHQELSDMMKKLKIPFALTGLSLGKKNKYGRLESIWVHYKKGKKEIPASTIRSILGTSRLRSTFFVIGRSPNGVIFQGRGWGHGVGMCQVGAKEMGDRGFSCEDILRFYYPGADIYTLWKSER